MKLVKNDVRIFGRATREDAEHEARMVVNERVRVVGVIPQGRLSPDVMSEAAYFIVPEGEKCPCCSNVVQFGKEFCDG